MWNSNNTFCTEHLWTVTSVFWTYPDISHFTFHISLQVLYDNWLLWKLLTMLLTSYIRLCNYVKLNSNERVKVAHLQKLASQSVLNGTLVIEKWLNNSFSESKKNFCRFITLWTPEICISTRFAKYLSYLEVQKNSKVYIRKKEVCSKSVVLNLFGKWMHFQTSLSLWR